MTSVEDAERVGLHLDQTVPGGEHGHVNRDLVFAVANAGLFDRLFSADGITAAELCSIRRRACRNARK